MTNKRFTILMFSIVLFVGTVSARHPPALFLTRFETPDDFYNDEITFNNERVKKYNFQLNGVHQLPCVFINVRTEISGRAATVGTKMALVEDV